MAEDIFYPDGFYDVVMKLEHQEQERMRKLLEEHHRLKVDYERRYYLQVDNVNMGNRKFQERQKLMRPYDYAKELDQKLMLEARTSLKQQRELEQRMKEERERRKAANQNKEKPVTANDNHPAKKAFREQAKETSERQPEPVKKDSQQKQQSKEPEKKAQDKDIDPRRLAFRKEMEEINRQNEKHKDKGLDKEAW